MPELVTGIANQAYKKRRFLSLLYLAVTRAARNVDIFVNDEMGGVPEAVQRAVDQRLALYVRGSEV